MERLWRWLLVAGLVMVVGCGGLDETAELDELDGLDENGCYPGELYDPIEDVCYIECDSEAECAALEAEIYGDGEVFEPEPEATAVVEPAFEPEPIPDTEPADESLSAPESRGDDEPPPFARYAVDERLNLTLLEVVDDTAVDTAGFEAVWEVIRDLLPPDILVAEVREYQVFTDGPDETLAYVEPLAADPAFWLMAIDTADVQVVNGTLSDDVVHTIVHEFAHIVTLENNQVPPDPDAGAEEGSAVAVACQTFYTGEGCSLPDSYINQFFLAYWDDLFDELLDIEAIEDQLAYEDALYAFYEQYEDRFVTDYAATNPGEDIAESFTFFVLRDAPVGGTQADEKVLFFYDFPQMVAIREHIRAQLGE